MSKNLNGNKWITLFVGYLLIFGAGSLITILLSADVTLFALIGGLVGVVALIILGTFLLLKKDGLTRSREFEAKLFTNLYNNSPDAIFLMDYYSQRIEDCNDVAVELFELQDKAKLLGDHGHSLVLPVLTEDEFLECRKTISVKGKWSKTVKQRTTSGRKFDAEMHITPLGVDKKNYYIIRVRDITEKLAREEDLKESTEKLANIMESIDSIVYNISIDEDGNKKLSYISKSIEQIYGLSADEYVKLIDSGKILDLYHPDDTPAIRESSKLLSEQRQPVSLQYRFFHQKLKSYVWIEERVYPRFSADGKHIANFGITTNIQNRKQYEEALEASEKRYRNLFERNLSGVYMVDAKDQVMVDCNQSFAEILGFEKREQVIGKKTSELYEVSESMKQFYERIIEKKQLFNLESEVMLKSGRTIWVLENASLIEDEGQQFVEGTISDITELKEAQRAYKESEETLSNVINTIDDLVYNVELDDEGNKTFKYISPQIKEMVGLTTEEYIELVKSGDILQYFHMDDLERIRKNVDRINKERKATTVVYRFKDKNTGDFKWLEENIYPKLEDGKIIAEMGIIRDVTKRIEYENYIKQSEQRFRTLFERNLAGVFRSNPEGEIIECNDAFAQIFGYSKSEELQGAEALDLYFSMKSREDYLSELKEKGFLQNYEMHLKRRDGSTLWVLANVSISEPNEQGEQFIEGALIDITELKITSEALLESESRFRTLAESTLEGIVISDDYRIIDVNDQFVKMLGYDSAEELLGEPLDIVVAPDFRDTVKEKISVDPGEPYEGRAIKKDGTIIIVETTGKYIPYNGKTVRVSVIYDITGRKEAEENLKERERAMSTLLGNLPGMAYRCANDEYWTMEFASNGVYDLTGYSPEDLINNKTVSFAELIIPEDVEMVADTVEKQLAKGKPFVVEYRIKDKNGQLKWIWEQGEAIRDEKGNVTALEGFLLDTTTRKEFEQQLQINEENFRNIAEHSPTAILIHRDGKIVYSNHTAHQFFQLEKGKTLTEKELNSLFVENGVKKVEKLNKAVEQGKDPGPIEVYGKTVKGQEVPLAIQQVKTFYHGEEAIYMILQNLEVQQQLAKEQLRAQVAEEINKRLEEEISDHKKTQRKLRDAERFTRNIFESSLDMILSANTDNEITSVNQAGLQRFGYERDELIGQDPEILYAHKEQIEYVKKQVETTGQFTGEILNIDKEGNTFPSFLSASLIKNEEGKVIGSMGVSRDITEIKRAETKVKISEERYQEQSSKIRSIFESTADIMIWTLDKDLKVTSFNRQFEEVVKKTFGGVAEIGKDFEKMIDPFTKREHKKGFRKTVKSAFKGKPQQLEGPMTDKNGNLIWIEQFLSPIKLENGDINEIACLAHETTEKKANEKQIRDSLQEKEVLLKEVHHRVKNNLQVISSILNLQSSYVKDDNTLNILRESQNRIKSMSFIHESLYQNKDFSQINFSDYVINLSNNLVHSYQLYGDLVDLEHDVDDVSLSLDQSIPCGLIINELVSNALKYAFTSEHKGKLLIGVKESEGRVHIRVEDDGIGLPKDFDISNTETLGLQLVITLTEQLDGKLEVESDSGTRYLITFAKQM